MLNRRGAILDKCSEGYIVTPSFQAFYRDLLDTSIRPHTDASAVTLNVNLNLPDEQFIDSIYGKVVGLGFTLGCAMLHRGDLVHAAIRF